MCQRCIKHYAALFIEGFTGLILIFIYAWIRGGGAHVLRGAYVCVCARVCMHACVSRSNICFSKLARGFP